MSIVYELKRLIKNKPELMVELNQNQIELMFRALNEYQDAVYDEDSPYYDEQDASDYSDLQFKLSGV